jgi:UDP-N-acetylglucosamine 2-epimerase (non-hydrolysing)
VGFRKKPRPFGLPFFTPRKNAERPVTVSKGTKVLVGTDPEKIFRATADVLAGKNKAGCLLRPWDGKAADRVLVILLKSLPEEEAALAISQ